MEQFFDKDGVVTLCITAYKPQVTLDEFFISVVQHCLQSLRCLRQNLYLRFHQLSYNVNSEYDWYHPRQRLVDVFGGSKFANVVLHENICHTRVPVDDFLTICTPEQKIIKEEVDYVTWLPRQGFPQQDSACRYCHDEFRRLLLWYQPNWQATGPQYQWRCNTHGIYRILSCQRNDGYGVYLGS